MTHFNPNPRKHSPFFQGKLYARMSDDLQLAGLSELTQQVYLRAVRHLADHCKTSVSKITEAQLRCYFLHLKNEKHYAYGSMRCAFSGIKFFYTRTCKRSWETLATMKLQKVKTLPEVLTIKQVHSLIKACTAERLAVYFWTVYSLGLRLQEGLNLQVGDIDAERGMVHVHRGKGAKDRYIPLPTSTLQSLRRYWATHRHPRFLFPCQAKNHKESPIATTPMQRSTVQGGIKKITQQIDLGKNVTVHTFRHSYATHLLEAGVSLRIIQQYLGHSSLRTTMIYLHLTDSATVDARKVIEKLFRRP